MTYQGSKENSTIDLEQFPLEMRDKIKEDIDKHGEEVTGTYPYMASLWKMVYKLKGTDLDISWMATAIYIINFFATKDPLPIHYTVAREILKQKKVSENKAVDMLARELVESCQNFKKFLEKESERECRFSLSLQNENGYLVSMSTPQNELSWEKEECNAIDFLFSEFLDKHFRKTGKNAAKALLKDSQKRFQTFKNPDLKNDSRPLLWNNWIDKEDGIRILSPYLFILADIVWEDCCLAIWKRETRNVPALTQGVHPSVVKILSHKIKMKDIESTLHLIHETQVIAKLPTINPNLIQTATKGVGKLSSLYHHKLIRFECRSGFEDWASGKADSRVLRFERGCSEIAQRLELHSNQAIEIIKALLHAQAHLQFSFEDGSSGNLIILNKFRTLSSGREEGIIITLGPQLLPHYTFQTSKKNRLLIPVPELPPLVASSNSHASQAALQMLLMQMFANKSIELAKRESILISEKEWERMRKEADLPLSIFKQTIDRWLNDGNDGPKFIVKNEIDRYSLGPTYFKEQKFLIDQGILRKKRQKDGEKSARFKEPSSVKI